MHYGPHRHLSQPRLRSNERSGLTRLISNTNWHQALLYKFPTANLCADHTQSNTEKCTDGAVHASLGHLSQRHTCYWYPAVCRKQEPNRVTQTNAADQRRTAAVTALEPHPSVSMLAGQAFKVMCALPPAVTVRGALFSFPPFEKLLPLAGIT